MASLLPIYGLVFLLLLKDLKCAKSTSDLASILSGEDVQLMPHCSSSHCSLTSLPAMFNVTAYENWTSAVRLFRDVDWMNQPFLHHSTEFSTIRQQPCCKDKSYNCCTASLGLSGLMGIDLDDTHEELQLYTSATLPLKNATCCCYHNCLISCKNDNTSFCISKCSTCCLMYTLELKQCPASI